MIVIIPMDNLHAERHSNMGTLSPSTPAQYTCMWSLQIEDLGSVPTGCLPVFIVNCKHNWTFLSRVDATMGHSILT